MCRLQLRDDVDEHPMEHLTHGLVGALDENLLQPPVVLRQVIQEPLRKYTKQQVSAKATHRLQWANIHKTITVEHE